MSQELVIDQENKLRVFDPSILEDLEDFFSQCSNLKEGIVKHSEWLSEVTKYFSAQRSLKSREKENNIGYAILIQTERMYRERITKSLEYIIEARKSKIRRLSQELESLRKEEDDIKILEQRLSR